MPLTLTYYSPIHTTAWHEEMERLGASPEDSKKWNDELPCAVFISFPPTKHLIPIKYYFVSRRFTQEVFSMTADYRRILFKRLSKCLVPMTVAPYLSYVVRVNCTREFNYHLSRGRVIFGGLMPNTANSMRRTLLPADMESIYLTKTNFLGRYTEAGYWNPGPGEVYGSVNESLSWIAFASLYQWSDCLKKVAVTMRDNTTPLDDYVYWFALEAFRWLDNGSIEEIELVYEQDGLRDQPPQIWDEFLSWASQSWIDNPAASWRFGWHGLDYIRRWSSMKWRFQRVPERILDQRGRFMKYWDHDQCEGQVVEEVVVWSVKKLDSHLRQARPFHHSFEEVTWKVRGADTVY